MLREVRTLVKEGLAVPCRCGTPWGPQDVGFALSSGDPGGGKGRVSGGRQGLHRQGARRRVQRSVSPGDKGPAGRAPEVPTAGSTLRPIAPDREVRGQGPIELLIGERTSQTQQTRTQSQVDPHFCSDTQSAKTQF